MAPEDALAELSYERDRDVLAALTC